MREGVSLTANGVVSKGRVTFYECMELFSILREAIQASGEGFGRVPLGGYKMKEGRVDYLLSIGKD